MGKNLVARFTVAVMLVTGPGLSWAWAHCDTVEGPVVKAARNALEQGDVRLALIWVRPVDEQEVRSVFERVSSIRQRDGAARYVADRLFLETVVRLHRAGEGMPYTGIKWEAAPIEEGIALAESSLTAGSVAPVLHQASERLRQSLEELYGQVSSARQDDPGDVKAGRRYVEAYVRYIHQVEALFALLPPGEGKTTGGGAPHQHH